MWRRRRLFDRLGLSDGKGGQAAQGGFRIGFPDNAYSDDTPVYGVSGEMASSAERLLCIFPIANSIR